MPATTGPANAPVKDRISELVGAPDGVVAFARDVVARHPLASLGAVAAGLGTYVLLSHWEPRRNGANGTSKARGKTAASRRARKSSSRRRARGAERAPAAN